MAVEGAPGCVHLCFAKLVEIFQELNHMCTATPGESERWLVVAEVLKEGVPVSPLLSFISAGLRWRQGLLRWTGRRRRWVGSS
jgi:hypothetical protein